MFIDNDKILECDACILHLGILIHQGPPVTQSVVFGVGNEDIYTGSL